MEKTGLFSIAYLAPIEYFQLFVDIDKVYIESCEQYQKQSFRNRCQILTANGVLDLSIPVEKGAQSKQLVRDVRISSHSEWQIQHWRALESAYSSSPFFEYYKDDLWPYFTKKWNFLWDFNWELHLLMLDLLETKVQVNFTADFQSTYSDDILDFRSAIHPKMQSCIKLNSYYQVFESKFGFVPNLSIVDLLFNMGNESQLIIKNG